MRCDSSALLPHRSSARSAVSRSVSPYSWTASLCAQPTRSAARSTWPISPRTCSSPSAKARSRASRAGSRGAVGCASSRSWSRKVFLFMVSLVRCEVVPASRRGMNPNRAASKPARRHERRAGKGTSGRTLESRIEQHFRVRVDTPIDDQALELELAHELLLAFLARPDRLADLCEARSALHLGQPGRALLVVRLDRVD